MERSDLEKQGQVIQFVPDSHYGDKSHIKLFIINTNEARRLYKQSDIRHQNLTPFSGKAQTSLCLRTTLTENELCPSATQNRHPVIWVIWCQKPEFLQAHQNQLQKISDRFQESFKSAYAKTIQNPVDEHYLIKTQEVVEELLRQNSKEALVQFTLDKMRELAPDTDSISFGEISGREQALQLVIKAVRGRVNDQYRTANPLLNGGLWQRSWESKQMTVVNNRDAVNALAFKNLPLEDAKSALCVPVFNRHDNMIALFSLSSLEPDAYLKLQQGMVEWLAQAFSSRRQQIETLKKQGANISDDLPKKELTCIGEIIELFSQLGNDASTNHEELMIAALKKVAETMEVSSWAIFERCDERQKELRHQQTLVSYRVLKQHKLQPDYTQHLHSLHRSPVNDLLGKEHSDVTHLLCADMSGSAYKHLNPLLSHQKSCLAVPVKVQRSHPGIVDDPGVYDDVRLRTYGLFLFHFSIEHFNHTQLDFIKMAILLIEALLKRQTLDEDLRKLMPSVVQGTMSAQFAHEIKNPCVPLASLIHTLAPMFTDHRQNLEALLNQHFVEDLIGLLKICAQELHKIQLNVDNLMRFSNLREPHPAVINMPKLLQELADYGWYDTYDCSASNLNAEGLLSSQRVRIKVKVDTPDVSKLPAVKLDPFHLKMVLTNLINNAVYAILFSKQNQRSENKITLRVHYPEKESQFPLALQVEDNGAGMELAVLNQLFEPFFTTKAAGGFGLGCTISKVMIEQFGGQIEVKSVIGAGSTFTIRIPAKALVHEK